MRRRPESPHRDPRAGVTLLEILIAIGVIAILTGILLPVVGSVRRRAVQLRCESSLAGIGKMYSAYASEHDGAWATFEYPRRLSGMVDVHRVPSWGRSGGWLILPINEMTFWGFLLRDYAVPNSEKAVRQAVERLTCPVAFDRWLESLPPEERDGRVEILNPMASPQESYYHSLALFTRPSGWTENAASVPQVNPLHSQVRTTWVRHPARKAVLVEKRSYHGAREQRIETAASHPFNILAADGHVEQRSAGSALTPSGFVARYTGLEIPSQEPDQHADHGIRYVSTAQGAWGRDW